VRLSKIEPSWRTGRNWFARNRKGRNLKCFAGRIPMDRARQDWKMSTQRPEARTHLATTICRMLVRLGLQLFRGEGRSNKPEASFRSSPARSFAQDAENQTAPPAIPDRAATKSLQPDHTNQQPARLVPMNIRLGSPPLVQAAFRWHCDDRSRDRSEGSPPIHLPVVSPRSHRALPWAPAAQCRRTERYDGKRDLYFQHAA
jgi:hypothetical protein